MREILFRGKTCSGRWAEGSLIHAGYYCCILEDEDKVHPSDYPYLDNGLGYIDGKATPVDLGTVGQFTGLLDKNGKKIFEGDIVLAKFASNRSRHKFEVGFYNGCFCFHNGMVKVTTKDVYSFEVLGNIHDNPEMGSCEK
jgi:hypothetical protein